MAPSGKNTQGICDRCGQAWMLHELRAETVNMVRQANRVCPDCFDPDHPQYQISKVRFWDEISVPDIRPQDHLDQGYDWRDVFGNVLIPSGLHVKGTGIVASVTVTIT